MRVAALLVGVAVAVAALPVRAESPSSPPPIPRVEPVPSDVALQDKWPPPRLYERRSSGLFVFGVIVASVGATGVIAGAVAYGAGEDPCAAGTLTSPDGGKGFCTADRTPFIAGATLMGIGGALFGLGIPLAVMGSSGAAKVTVVPKTSGAALRFQF